MYTIRMPNGKFRGKAMQEIPSKYLRWVAENYKNDTVAAAADNEWQWREKWDEHWD